MGLLLHGVREANLELVNTLEVHTNNVPEKDKFPLSLPIRHTVESFHSKFKPTLRCAPEQPKFFLFSTSWRTLPKAGRAAVIVPEGVLFRGGPTRRFASVYWKSSICTLSSRCQQGAFLPYTGVKANVLVLQP